MTIRVFIASFLLLVAGLACNLAGTLGEVHVSVISVEVSPASGAATWTLTCQTTNNKAIFCPGATNFEETSFSAEGSVPWRIEFSP